MFPNRNTLTTSPEVVAQIVTMDDELLTHLREMVRQHQVCYEVWPEWSMKDGSKIENFELQLYGISSHADSNANAQHPVPGCPICLRTYSDLREIAEWALPATVALRDSSV